MMAFLALRPVDDDVVPMFLEDLHLDGADARAITWGDEIPDDVRADAHVVVIGCGESGLLAGIRLAQAGLPFTIVEKNGGPGRHLVGEPLPGRPGRRRQPLLLLLVRARRPLDRVLLPAARAARLLRARRSTKYDLERTAGSAPRSTRATWDEATGGWAVDVTQPRRHHRGARRAVRHQRGRCAEPATLPDIPGMDDVRRAVVPLGAVGPTTSTIRGKRFALDRRRRERLPDRADHRRRGRAAHRLPAHRAVDVPEPELPPARCPTASAGRCGTCRSTDAGSASSPSIPGAGLSHRALPHRSRLRRRRARRSARRTRATREHVRRAGSRAQLGDDAELEAKAIPDYPPTAQADAAGQRLVARVPAEGQRRARAHGHRAHRRRRRGHRRRRASVPPTSSATPPASGTTTSSGR